MTHTARTVAALLAVLMILSPLAMTACGDTTPLEASGETTDAAETMAQTRPTEEIQATTEEPIAETSSPVAESPSEAQGSGVWVNALDIGFVGDGKTPNDTAFALFLKNGSTRTLYFPEGVYCFEKTLNFPTSMHVKMDATAELRCIAEEPLDFFITLRGQFREISDAWVPWLEYAQGAGIDGGIINCDYKAKCALGLFQGMHTNFENFKILNVLEKGVQTLISETHDGCYNFSNVFIYNTRSIPGSIGVFDNNADNHFHKISVCNFDTAFYTIGGRFLECTAWNLDMGPIANTSTFAEVHGDQSVWYNPSVDTVRYGFRMMGNGATTSVIDMVWITNQNFYTVSLQKSYPRTMFWAEKPDTAKILVTGLQFRNEENLNFSNDALPKSVFLNVRAPADYDTASMPYYRNDLEELLLYRKDIVEGVKGNGSINITGNTDFDTVTEAGLYDCELRVGKNGKNAPSVKEAGLLRVEVLGAKIIQTFTGSNTTMERIYDGVKWSAWRQ